MEKAVGYLDWRMWGLRRWFNDELSSSAMADGGHSGRARGQAGLGFICAEDGGGRTGSLSNRGRGALPWQWQTTGRDAVASQERAEHRVSFGVKGMEVERVARPCCRLGLVEACGMAAGRGR